ncbi:MAG TPA: N-6 DNA methylase [Treponema sp.]|nr:N-6 DNA methylase [Treponema sp.]
MLDTDTKRRIDTARDILVGKVPDPKSQVEQITIALIYKFMDDMDRESVEMGGKRGFFIGEYEKYSWSNIFNPRIGGHEMLNLYAEAITRMSQNPNLPELFRNIFKNAYLPYRDPETLKLFLKTINEFTYDHSERLGDAFEYLLLVLGSQGDAGQFRTPRHIIDFMVEIVSPKKNELILDPACGTAGFLISAYKHIMRENTSEKYRSSNGNGMGDLLTPDERKKLLTNFKGYDISPDMVRISLVNMYLHGFVNPQIYEYDTLTSEDRWNDYADVILANPPFMTPKGGIKPHKRFSLQSNRSEVLFVDYIAEHLTPTGRAAVIVPEGIIFQSANAYKQLRKALIEKYLFAVVSLPAGVFQPYAGVKTSILLMDKVLSKKTDSILFIKIENDGFDLGAQRRPIDKNDLPDALQVIREYIDKVRNGKANEFNADEKPCSALLVKKEKLAENGEYNLTGDRYRVVEKRKHQKWPMVKLGEVCEIYQPQTITTKELNDNGKYKVYGANGIIGYYDKYNHEDSEVIVTCRGATCGTVNISEPKSWITGNAMVVTPFNKEKINKNFLYYLLKFSNLNSTISGAAQPQITRQTLSPFQIPLPPLEVQKEIVAEIEGYQKIIDGCRQVIDAWKPDVETYLDEELKAYLATDQNNLVYDKLKEALEKFRMQDFYLIETDSNERAITAKIVCYLQEQFQSWNVDHEFNRNQEDIKRDNQGNRIIPDIIIHKRGTNDNLVMIEVKKHIFSNEYKERLRNNAKDLGYKYAFAITIDKNKPVEKWIEPLIVEKAKKDLLTSWPMVKLGEVCSFEYGKSLPEKSRKAGEYPVMGSNGRTGFHNEYLIEGPAIIIGRKGSSGEVVWEEKNCFPIDTTYYVVANKQKANFNWLYYILKNLKLTELSGGAGIPGLNRNDAYLKEIPLPPLVVQSRIVDKIESERKVIDSLREMVKTYEEKIKKVIAKVWEE